MWSKIYLCLLAIGIIVMVFFTYYSWTWLQSIGDPRSAWDAFNFNKRMGVYSLIASTGALLLIGNIVLWMSRSAWAMWTSFVYFTVFVILLLVLMHLMGTQFCESHSVCDSPSRMVGPLLAAFGIGVLGVGVFLNQFLVLRLHAKMYSVNPTPVVDGEQVADQVEKKPKQPRISF